MLCSFKKFLWVIGFIFFGIILFYNCKGGIDKPETTYETYCGNCHLVPDPKNITKEIWQSKVLPNMAARLGYKLDGYNPYAGNSMEENLYIRLSNAYPKEPLIDSTRWNQIYDYVIGMAPDSIPKLRQSKDVNKKLDQFSSISQNLNESTTAAITGMWYDDSNHQLNIGDGFGNIYNWQDQRLLESGFKSPVIAYKEKEGNTLIAEIGFMNPSDRPLGTIYKMNTTSIDTIAQKLHRPVFVKSEDLNTDAKEEILVCEFGNLLGQLSLFVEQEQGYDKRTLLSLPGTIKFELADMNNDGKKDIILLASQGKEGIYILYQGEDLDFSVFHTIKMGPEYGTSWFELVDYNKDGFLDIILVNGDNADYSNFLKPYHGLRIFINDGKNNFKEDWFYPVYGATRIVAEDFDRDGDIDFGILSFFPDFDQQIEKSFIYLENKNSTDYLFRASTTEAAEASRWMVMEKGDFDADGDIDIMLGGFLLPMKRKHQALFNKWRTNKVDLLFLKNNLIQNTNN